MSVSVRFHREDPWELIRLMRAAMPNTFLNFITTGMRFIAWQPCDEAVMRLAFRCVVRNGIRRFQFAEPANDAQALRRAARMAREEGVEEIVVGLTYSISPVHTHAYYAERVAALADCADIDRFYLKDPGGLLTTDAVRELAPHFVATGRTVELHSHCTIGLAPQVYMEGLRAGFHVLHTAIGPAGNGTSQPTVESTLRNLGAEGYAHRLDTGALSGATDYFRELVRAKRLPPGEPREYDAAYYHHQLPGGMVTTTRRMLEEIRRPELFDAVLDEVVRVRAEMGYPILVTPVSQLVAFQATRNVIDPERWLNVSDETVRYFLGHYGEFAAPPDPGGRRPCPLPVEGREAARRAAGQPRGRSRALRRSDLGRGAPAQVDDAAGASRCDARGAADRGTHVGAGHGGRRSARAASARGRTSPIDLVPPRPQGRRPRGVAPCVLTASPASSSTSTGRSCTGRADEVRLIPGAREALERITASGRPYALFTNGSHMPPDAFARELRAAGLPVEDGQVLTPLCSVQRYLDRLPGEVHVLPFLTDAARAYLDAAGVHLVDGRNGASVDAVFVAHAEQADFDQLERAARAVIAGARLLTGSYVSAYAGAHGPILSRGAMITAAIAKASSARPIVVGKPSRAAVSEMHRRLGVQPDQMAVIGDDLLLDVALGRLGRSTTILVRSGITGSLDLGRVPEKRRPHAVVETVAELLEWL